MYDNNQQMCIKRPVMFRNRQILYFIVQNTNYLSIDLRLLQLDVQTEPSDIAKFM